MVFYFMSLIMDENPTRKKIIMLLKKSEHLTVAEMSKEMGITSMAVRQHLMSLEKRGIINYTTRKYGIGRPVFLYKLTDVGLDFFTKAYGTLAKDVLGIVESMDGREKVASIFEKRMEKQLTKRRAAIGHDGPVAERLMALASTLDKEGYMVETRDLGDAMELKKFNCLIYNIVGDYPEPCEFELKLYNELFNGSVERLECQRDGNPACVYTIRK